MDFVYFIVESVRYPVCLALATRSRIDSGRPARLDLRTPDSWLCREVLCVKSGTASIEAMK